MLSFLWMVMWKRVVLLAISASCHKPLFWSTEQCVLNRLFYNPNLLKTQELYLYNQTLTQHIQPLLLKWYHLPISLNLVAILLETYDMIKCPSSGWLQGNCDSFGLWKEMKSLALKIEFFQNIVTSLKTHRWRSYYHWHLVGNRHDQCGSRIAVIVNYIQLHSYSLGSGGWTSAAASWR